MSGKETDIRRYALDYDRDMLVRYFLTAHNGFPHKNSFLELILESYHCFLSGYWRASLIVSGEALLRAIYDSIVRSVRERGQVTRRGKTWLDANSKELDELQGRLPFAEAIQCVRENEICRSDTIGKMEVVRHLRNRAVHGHLPMLDDWDPEEHRSKEQFLALLEGKIEIPEGYRFIPERGSETWFTFDLRDYRCGSFRDLARNERLAAIQFLLVVSVVRDLVAGATVDFR